MNPHGENALHVDIESEKGVLVGQELERQILMELRLAVRKEVPFPSNPTTLLNQMEVPPLHLQRAPYCSPWVCSMRWAQAGVRKNSPPLPSLSNLDMTACATMLLVSGPPLNTVPRSNER